MFIISSIRILSIICVLGIIANTSATVWLPIFWSYALAHYALAFWYARKRFTIFKELRTALPAFFFITLGLAAYILNFPLLFFFGIHHAFNEVYLNSRCLPRINKKDQIRYNIFGLLFHAFLYLYLFRAYPIEHKIPSEYFAYALALSGLLYIGAIIQMQKQLKNADFFWLIFTEPAVAACLILLTQDWDMRVEYIIFYHVVFWTFFPIGAFYKKNPNQLINYFALTLLVIAFFTIFSPLIYSNPDHWQFYESQFYLWGYIHITFSFFMSDAHPAWITRWFRVGGSPISENVSAI